MASIIQLRRDTAANWTSNDPILAQGEIGYETDTNQYKIGDGSTAWSSLSYFAASILTTKGDLLSYSTAEARLGVGADNSLLVADSAQATGLNWTAAPTLTTVNTTGDITSGSDFEAASAGAMYFGDQTTDGTWRIVRSGNDLVIERRESSSWVTKTTITA